MIVHFFDTLYTSVSDRNNFLKKIRFYSFKRFCIRFLANLVIPIYFKISKKSFPKDPIIMGEKKIVVSLTSFPARISKVWIVIESILRQRCKPDKIVLWLSNEQFSGLSELPGRLVKQIKAGLEVRFVNDDLKSHKKYYYAIEEFPNDIIITVDDDIIYSEMLIEMLVENHKIYPDFIISHRASLYKYNKNEYLPYSEWVSLKTEMGPSLNIFQTSGGGTLFPPKSLNKDVLNKEVFLNLCPHADDIWLNFMSQLNKTPIYKTSYYSDYLPVLYYKNRTLSTYNVYQRGNDFQLKNLQTYYKTNLLN